MFLTFEVKADEHNMLLRDFLRKKAVSSSLSRSVKTHGGFYLNEKSIKTNERIKAGKSVCFKLPSDELTHVIAQNLPIDIVYEDEHAMLINKPAGQTVHPTLNYKDGTLANAFCALMKKRGQGKIFRPINRLDKNTSGLVLCALNEYAAPILAANVSKTYIAIVHGKTAKCGEICLPIALLENSFIKRTVAFSGKKSITQYKTLQQNEHYSLLEIKLITGRTHQIRVHFSSINHPLVGDDLYGGSTEHVKRQMLACKQMSFINIAETYGAIFRDNIGGEYRKDINSNSDNTININISLPNDMLSFIDNFLLQ